MTKLPGCVAAAAIGAAIVTATPAVALHGGGMRMGRPVFVGGFRDPACVRHRRDFRNFGFVGGPFRDAYAGYGNICWQQVWTPYGWLWVDACSGPYGYGY